MLLATAAFVVSKRDQQVFSHHSFDPFLVDWSAPPPANATGHLIFNNVNSLLQRWPNTYWRNGTSAGLRDINLHIDIFVYKVILSCLPQSPQGQSYTTAGAMNRSLHTPNGSHSTSSMRTCSVEVNAGFCPSSPRATSVWCISMVPALRRRERVRWTLKTSLCGDMCARRKYSRSARG